MSRAFTKELDDVPADIGDRPVSQHRNLVTENGLRLIDAEILRLKQELADAGQPVDDGADKSVIMHLSRDLRYWTIRRETAELTVPAPDSEVIRFGMRVQVENADGKTQSWSIVGEDEADPAAGTISHISPLAVALFGKGVGELITLNGRELEILAFEPI